MQGSPHSICLGGVVMQWSERFRQFFEKNQREYLMILEVMEKTGVIRDPLPNAALYCARVRTPDEAPFNTKAAA